MYIAQSLLDASCMPPSSYQQSPVGTARKNTCTSQNSNHWGCPKARPVCTRSTGETLDDALWCSIRHKQRLHVCLPPKRLTARPRVGRPRAELGRNNRGHRRQREGTRTAVRHRRRIANGAMSTWQKHKHFAEHIARWSSQSNVMNGSVRRKWGKIMQGL